MTPKNKKIAIVAGIFTTLLLIIGIIATIIWFQNRNNAEYLAYCALEDNYNIADYEAFLNDYPNGHYAEEIAKRMKETKDMLDAWRSIGNYGSRRQYIDFKEKYNIYEKYVMLCDHKIDSIDWEVAVQANTLEAYQAYLADHPEGFRAAEASIATGQIQDTQVSTEDQEYIFSQISSFFQGFGNNDAATYCAYITPTLSTFLGKHNVTKVDVQNTIEGMFNEHIESVSFTINNDMQVSRSKDENGKDHYTATFTVDQRIKRNNEGKTYGSYTANAELNAQYMICALTLNEVSRR